MSHVSSALSVFLIALGTGEVLSNLYHLTRGSKEKIASSARKQHGEIPQTLPDSHFFAKVCIMLFFGLLLLLAALIPHSYFITPVILSLFGAYGVIQAIVYKGYWRTVSAAVVYNLPLLIYLLFSYQG